MKKTVRILSLTLAVLMLAATALTLASCGSKLSGTYKTEGLLTYQTYTFDGDKVTIKTYGGISGTKLLEFEGTYKIDGDEITITYAEDEDTGDALAAGTYEFKKTDDGIKIGTKEMTKQ